MLYAMRLDGYVRVSRVGGREGEGYISPSVQKDAIKQYAKDLKGKIVEWHDDQDYSGGNIERPGFQRCLERLAASESDGVVVMGIDRFSRSTADGYQVVREITDRGQVFASCNERIDPRTPEGSFMLRQFLSNAELFLDQAKARWWTAKARAVARGAHIGPTPIGYQRKEGCLSPNSIYGPAMTELFTLAAGGQHGDSALAQWMTERAPRQGGRGWQPSEIRRWLSNRVYLGEVRYGELINEEAHEALTDPATWERCQREAGVQRKAHSKFLLSGLVRCAACRYAMGGQTYGGAKQDTPIYRCTGRGGCPEPSVIVAERLEGYVTKLATERLKGLRLEAVKAGAGLGALEREAAEADTEVAAFASDLKARKLLGEEEWTAALEFRVADRNAKTERRDQAHAEHQLVSLARNVDDLSDQELRDLLDGMVRHVFVRRRRGAGADERALVVWSDDTREIPVPAPHVSGPFESVRW